MIRPQPLHFIAACALPALGLFLFSKQAEPVSCQLPNVTHVQTVVSSNNTDAHSWHWDDRWNHETSNHIYLIGHASPHIEVTLKPSVEQVRKHPMLKRQFKALGHLPEVPLIVAQNLSGEARWAFMPPGDQKYARNSRLYPNRISVADDVEHIYAVYHNDSAAGGEVYALSRETGKIKWRMAFRGESSARLKAHRIHIEEHDGELTLYAKEQGLGVMWRVDAATGNLKHRKVVPKSISDPHWNAALFQNSLKTKVLREAEWGKFDDGTHTYLGGMGYSAQIVAMEKGTQHRLWQKTPQALSERRADRVKRIRFTDDARYLYAYIETSQRHVIETLDKRTGATLGVVTVGE